MDELTLRRLVWVGGVKKDFMRFPDPATEDFGHRLLLVQAGLDVPDERPLTKGVLKGLGIRELKMDFDRDTYRVVYTVKLRHAVYVLHAFKKKSRFGISTPVNEIELVRQRYLVAVELDKAYASPSAQSRKP